MDFKPIPPTGKVDDLRNAPQAKTQEQLDQEKQARQDKVRRNLRLVALVLACYYFASAGYSWYQEAQREEQATMVINLGNPLKEPLAFRTTFNQILNQFDTSLPTANANDTPEGFIAVLSTAVEMQGFAKANSKELERVQIQTRYPDALPPESIKAFQIFILSNERMVNPEASLEDANAILNNLGIIPKFDANENDKLFAPTTTTSLAFEYSTAFTSGPIDELTLTATPRINLDPADPNYLGSDAAPASDVPYVDGANTEASSPSASSSASSTSAAASDGADTAASSNSSDAVKQAANTDDVPAL